MTIGGFHAWLDGFSESFGDAPSPEQWAKIKAKLEALQAFRAEPAKPIYNQWPSPAIGGTGDVAALLCRNQTVAI